MLPSLTVILAALALTMAGATGALALEIKSAVLRISYPELLPISRLDLKPDDLGFVGAALADEDNQTTGSFLGMEFSTQTYPATPETFDAELQKILDDGVKLIVVIANAEDTLRIADTAGPEVLLLNAGARETSLRDDMCRANILHVTPSYNMLADAVVQFAIWKQWREVFLVHGSNPKDLAMRDAYTRAITKFGGEVVEQRVFEDTGGARRTDTGHVLVQRQIPVFTQNAPDHDVVIAADASDVFGPYLSYHSWTPRPVMGAGGLRPVSLHASHEAWGATQFQRRFEALSGRYVQEEDYDVWLAIRTIGEAVTRTNSADPAVLREYILGDEFELAAFKGRKVNFRKWNGQLRAPVLLTDGRLTVSVSPQEGYLHQRSTLDTIGLDEPESTCTAFDD
ncbi:MAG: ABC transporter substrate-binding protein [Pseudomonadota bacterium]